MENENLKIENYRLKNYINRTFEVVKYLFEFLVDSFKRIIDKFRKKFRYLIVWIYVDIYFFIDIILINYKLSLILSNKKVYLN